MATGVKKAKSPTAFPGFRLLPPKLQYKIWEYAVKWVGQRIFHAKLGSAQRNYKMSFWNWPKPPAVLHACQVSRDCAKKQLVFIFQDKEGNGTWWKP